MLDLFFWILFIGTPAICYFKLRIAGERVNKVSLINVTTLSIYAFSIVGTLPLFYHFDAYRFETGLQDKLIILTVLLYSCINLMVFLLGVIFVRRLLGLKPVPFRCSEIGSITSLQKAALLILFILCVFVLFEYLMRIDRIAIIAAFVDGPNAAMVARSDMGNNFQGKYHWFEFFMHNIGTFLTLSAYSYWLLKKTLGSFLVFFVAFLYSAFVAVMAIEKSPLAWLLIGIFMVHFLMRYNGYVKIRSAFYFLGIIVLMISAFYMFFMGSQNISAALWSVFSRAFSGSIAPAYFYLEYFPEYQGYLLGRTFPNPGGLMPYEPYLYTIEVMNWKFPWHLEKGVVGTAPTVFWGEAYANFGPTGIPVVAFLAGCALSTYTYFISKLEVNPVTVAFLVWSILLFRNLSVTGFSDFLYNIHFIFLFLIVLVILFLSGSLRLKS